MRRVILLLLYTGCGEGENGREGTAGARGATGPSGPSGAPGGGYRWHAADGTPLGYGPTPTYFDEDGYLWPLEVETGEVDLSLVPGFHRYLFAGTDCAGEEYAIDLPAPRVVMSGVLYGEPDSYYVRPDAAALDAVDVGSSRASLDAACATVAASIAAVPFDVLVSVPDLPIDWPGPLHIEVTR